MDINLSDDSGESPPSLIMGGIVETKYGTHNRGGCHIYVTGGYFIRYLTFKRSIWKGEKIYITYVLREVISLEGLG